MQVQYRVEVLFNYQFSVPQLLVSLGIDFVLSNSQVDESNKHTEDDEQFSREDEIMCSALEDIS